MFSNSDVCLKFGKFIVSIILKKEKQPVVLVCGSF